MNQVLDPVAGVCGRRPIAIDLYAGAGGLTLGMEQAGFDVVAAAELDPIHALTHLFNFPGTAVVCRDLSAGSPEEMAAVLRRAAYLPDDSRVEIDAVVGGPPCQGFSVGGVRDQQDERNEQLSRFVDLIVALRPKVFCLENVAGLLEARFDNLRRGAIQRLEAAGYEVSGYQQPVSAADYGVPQSRRRVLIMGGRDGVPAPRLKPVNGGGVTVGDALDGLPDLSRYRRLLASDSVEMADPDYRELLGASSEYARRLIGLTSDRDDLSIPRIHDPRILTNSLRTVHAAKTVKRFHRTRQGSTEPVSRLFRLSDDGVSRTLRAGTGTDRGSHTSPRPIHPSKDRVITVREAARLHGYPDWFRFHATNWHGHRQVGNSVPPPLGAAAGRALREALGATPAMPARTPHDLGDPAWLWMNQRQASETLETRGCGTGALSYSRLAI